MKTITVVGSVGEHHRLQAQVPEEVPSGPVQVFVLMPGGSVQLVVLVPAEDDAGIRWTQGLATEWAGDLADPRQDIYTLEDGKPVDSPW